MHANKPQIMEQQKKTREIYIKTQNSIIMGRGTEKFMNFIAKRMEEVDRYLECCRNGRSYPNNLFKPFFRKLKFANKTYLYT